MLVHSGGPQAERHFNRLVSNSINSFVSDDFAISVHYCPSACLRARRMPDAAGHQAISMEFLKGKQVVRLEGGSANE